MRSLTHPPTRALALCIPRLSSFLDHIDVGDQVVYGTLEAYSCKLAGLDKKLSRSLEQEVAESSPQVGQPAGGSIISDAVLKVAVQGVRTLAVAGSNVLTALTKLLVTMYAILDALERQGDERHSGMHATRQNTQMEHGRLVASATGLMPLHGPTA